MSRRRLVTQWQSRRSLRTGLIAIVCLLLTVGAATACGSDETAAPSIDTEQSATAQQEVVPEPAISGQELFSNNCSRCHGANLRGTNVGPSLLHEYYEPNHHSNASFVIAVLRGVRQHHWDFGNMPAVEGLDIEEVHAVICFIREAQVEDGLIDEVPTSTPC